MARSHYEVLGVQPTATAGELRRAYLERARTYHPDRYVDAGGRDRAEAERSMREVNEAWRVLGDPARRRRYDAERDPVTSVRQRWERPDERFVSRPDGTMPEELGHVDGASRVIRGLPWMVLVVVLFAIFVFTAYAVSGGSASTPAPAGSATSCVSVQPGPSVQAVDCGTSGARKVVAHVSLSEPCPAGTERLQTTTSAFAYCLEV